MNISRQELLAVVVAGMIAALVEFMILRKFGVQ